MSGPAVAIGYIFLIPSVLGMLLGVILLFGTGGAASEVASRNDQDYAVALQSVEGLTQEQVQAIGALEAPDADQLEELGLSAEQERAVLDADLLRSAGQVGAGAGAAIGGAMSFVLILFSFVGGLIGWLLTMKKTVLLCKNCRGVHAEAT